MKKFYTLFFLFLSLGLLLIPIVTYADETNMPSYYPSASGTYTKVHLVNPNDISVPDEATFCQQTSTVPQVPGTPGFTFINAGTIFADKYTGYLEICKTDGTVASYPGACFNRYGPSGSPTNCPINYQLMGSQNFSFDGSHLLLSWSCCFTGPTNNAPVSESGCFSTYGTSGAAAPSCTPVGVPPNLNAYDMGCETITASGSPIYKRNCCFNYSSLSSISYSSPSCGGP